MLFPLIITHNMVQQAGRSEKGDSGKGWMVVPVSSLMTDTACVLHLYLVAAARLGG
jgi:hypothetical protein